jgi:hypothetical protein
MTGQPGAYEIKLGYVLRGVDRVHGRDAVILLTQPANRRAAIEAAGTLGVVVDPSTIRRATEADLAQMKVGHVYFDTPRDRPGAAGSPPRSGAGLYKPGGDGPRDNSTSAADALPPEMRAAILRIADSPIIADTKRAVASGIAYVILLLYVMSIALPVGIGLGVGAMTAIPIVLGDGSGPVAIAALLLFSLAGLVVWLIALRKLMGLALR